MRSSTPSPRPRARGFTLIELLVAVAIGTVLVLAVTIMLVRYEAGRRTLTSVNDASQSGAYLTYSLDRLLRSAGSGYVQGWREAFGCQVHASRSGTVVLPRAGAFQAPFATVPQAVRLAPVVVHAGAGTDGSDVIAVMMGASGMGETPLPMISNSATANQVRVPATVGVRGNDLVLIHDGGVNCMLQQLTSGFSGGASQNLDFAGAYHASTIGGVALVDFYSPSSTAPAFVSPMGNVGNNRPVFQLIGVGDNLTLMSHDMLQMDGSDAPVPIADGVADLRVRYGVDTDSNGAVDAWVDPGVAPWNAATLQSGVGAVNNIRQIIALRVAVVVRNNIPEKDPVTGATLTLFPDLPTALQISRAVAVPERNYRWRVLDFVVPLRNVMLAPPP